MAQTCLKTKNFRAFKFALWIVGMKFLSREKYFEKYWLFRKILNWHLISYFHDENHSLAVFWFVHLNIFFLYVLLWNIRQEN